MFPLAFATILVLDELITFGLSAVFGRGGGAGAWLLLIACTMSCRLRLGTRSLLVMLASLLLLVVSVQELNASALYLTALIFMSVVVFASRMDVPIAGSRAFMRALEIVLAARLVSALGFDLFERISGLEVNRPTGLYSEPSHFAYYVAILYMLAVFCRPQDRKRATMVAIIALSITFSASAIIPLGTVLYDVSRNARNRGRMVIVACVCAVLMLAYQWEYLLERILFSGDEDTSLTVQVLVYYYRLFALHLTSAPLAAFGPDRFRDAYDLYASELGWMPNDLNSTDGSFLAVKLLVESGLPFLLLFLWVLHSRLKQTGATAVCLLLAQYMFLRGFGLTSSVVIALMLVAVAHGTRPVAPMSTLTRKAKSGRKRSPVDHSTPQPTATA